jgi:hypothetical protein
VGSGTHGELSGDWAATDPGLAEPHFYAEDVATAAPGNHPGLGSVTVHDVATSQGAAMFRGAAAYAAGGPAGALIEMAAWCYSTIRNP